jgi:hypothetical protein
MILLNIIRMHACTLVSLFSSWNLMQILILMLSFNVYLLGIIIYYYFYNKLSLVGIELPGNHKARVDVPSAGPSSKSSSVFPTKSLRSKSRISLCVFQVVASPPTTACYKWLFKIIIFITYIYWVPTGALPTMI